MGGPIGSYERDPRAHPLQRAYLETCRDHADLEQELALSTTHQWKNWYLALECNGTLLMYVLFAALIFAVIASEQIQH